MKKLVSTLRMDKKEWLKYRKQGIGGSDAGAVCGMNPYRTAMQVYQDKISEEAEEIFRCLIRFSVIIIWLCAEQMCGILQL